MGNLTADPELKYLPKGTAVCQFNLAINRRWKDEFGNQKEEVTFVGVKAWGRQAETIAQYIKKGRPLMVEGRLTQESWDDKTTGAKKSKTLVTLESFQFLDSGNRQDSNSSERPNGSMAPRLNASPTADLPAGGSNASNDDLPPGAEDDVPF